MSTLRERLIALADLHEIGPTAGNQDECREVALAAARMALEDAESECLDCVDHLTGLGYFLTGAEDCLDAVRALRDGLE